MWSSTYGDLVSRNIGLLTEKQQLKLKNSCVAVCGLGGLGGVSAEILARTGIESFRLLDKGTFEPTNLNRQIYSFVDSNGRLKTLVTEEQLLRINPDIKIEKYTEITEENVSGFLDGVDVVLLCIDSVLPCLILSRSAFRAGITLVEGWAVAFANVRVFTKDTPTLEEVYGFDTADRGILEISEEEASRLMFESIYRLLKIDGLRQYYPESVFERLETKGEGTTFAPMVWMTSTMMAQEAIKSLLSWGELSLAPEFTVYDGLQHRLIRQAI